MKLSAKNIFENVIAASIVAIATALKWQTIIQHLDTTIIFVIFSMIIFVVPFLNLRQAIKKIQHSEDRVPLLLSIGKILLLVLFILFFITFLAWGYELILNTLFIALFQLVALATFGLFYYRNKLKEGCAAFEELKDTYQDAEKCI